MPKILVVEDDEEHRKFISDALRSGGYEAVEAANGQEALEILRDQGSQIDLVTLDYSMPVMNGAECLKAMRENEEIKEARRKSGKRPEIPVVMITVYVTEIELKEMKESVDAFLPKPLSHKDILKTVRKTLKKAEK